MRSNWKKDNERDLFRVAFTVHGERRVVLCDGIIEAQTIYTALAR